MSILSNLSSPKSSFRKKRIGRGGGSGWGTTAAKGYKGQKARSGGGVPATFEGGQMPIWQRLPKFGFTNVFKKEFNIIYLSSLDSFDSEVTPDLLLKAKLVDSKNPIKVLSNGGIKKALHVKAHKFSKPAIALIEKAGGKAEVIKFVRSRAC